MPYGTEGWPQVSNYEKLDRGRGEIRLLSFHPRSESNSLSFTLVHHALSGRGSQAEDCGYYALSYVWGNALEGKPIYIDGKIVEIRATLWRALDALRNRLHNSSEEDATFRSPSGQPIKQFLIWVDFLCINQDDVAERNFQIQIMDQIFTAAQGVFGWLGDPNPDSEDAMSLLTNALLAEDFPAGPKEEYKGDRRKEIDGALSTLVSFEYWKRVWIIQEVALSSKFWMCSGQQMISWDDYSTLFSKRESGSPELPAAIDTEERKVAMTKARVFRTMKRRAVHKASLLDLVAMTTGYECTDPRDRVYGLLGLVKSADREKLEVDYRKPWLQVFTDACSLPEAPKAAYDFYLKLLKLCDGPGVHEAQRLIVEQGLAIRDVQLEATFEGIITDLRLRAAFCNEHGSTRFHLPMSKTGYTCDAGQHCYIYEYQADIYQYRYHDDKPIETMVTISFATAELQVGDVLLGILESVRAEIVLRKEHDGNLRPIATTARHYMPELGTLESAQEWLQNLQILDPSRWYTKRLQGEHYQLVDVQAANASVEKACREHDSRVWHNTKVVLSLNCKAVVNFLQEKLWCYYKLGKRGWLNTLDGWLQKP